MCASASACTASAANCRAAGRHSRPGSGRGRSRPPCDAGSRECSPSVRLHLALTRAEQQLRRVAVDLPAHPSEMTDKLACLDKALRELVQPGIREVPPSTPCPSDQGPAL